MKSEKSENRELTKEGYRQIDSEFEMYTFEKQTVSTHIFYSKLQAKNKRIY